MKIDKIVVNNFRILKTQTIYFSDKFNIIYGKNAQGKTSLIEAIYLLATGKSFRTRKLSELIFSSKINASVFANIENESYAISLNKEKKELYINKEKQKYVNYIGRILAISFTPEDFSLIIDSPEVRRRFFNYEIAQINKRYLKKLIEFQKILKIRNKMIKDADTISALFDIYNQKYIELSIDIYLLRKEYIENLEHKVNEKYISLFGKEKKLKLVYDSFYQFKSKDKLEMIKELKILLEQKLEKDIKYGFSGIGPQKDEYSFYLNNYKVKAFASQGEKKSVILALKLAQVDEIISKTNKNPIILLDDINAYFDDYRKKEIFKYFEEKNLQCFITTTDKIDVSAKVFEIKEGEISVQS